MADSRGGGKRAPRGPAPAVKRPGIPPGLPVCPLRRGRTGRSLGAVRHLAATRRGGSAPAPVRRARPLWAAAAALIVALAVPGADGARAQDTPPGPEAARLNQEALDVLEQIRRAYPIDFSEAHAIHLAIHAHLAAGGDPADIRHLVKTAVIEGCREACMEATFEGFTRLSRAGLAPAEVQTLLAAAIKDGRHGMPPRYTYEMLGAVVTGKVDQRLGASTATPQGATP